MAETEPDSFLGRLKKKLSFGREYVQEVDRSGFEYAETLTTKSLTGNGVVGARSRQLLYEKYQRMAADPVVSGSTRLHVTAALGGHETTGDLVFIEEAPELKGNAQAAAIVQGLVKDLSPILNSIAFQAAYNGAIFGDAYARLYPKQGTGITKVTLDEMLLPPLVLPYEQAGDTKVCVVSIGPKFRERLVMDQIARLKMPRMIYTPQPLAVEKAWRAMIAEDDPDKLPLAPSLVGGSFLADAELAYDNFQAALVSLVGQRVLDSIDESVLPVNVGGMTNEQRQSFLTNVKQMLTKSKALAEDAVKNNRPVLTRIRHILPVWAEKQLLSITGLNQAGGSGGGRAGTISVEDVMLHFKLLAGALGTDPSMLGFADLLSGGLGEGGFFCTSAQAAERSRVIRGALTEFFNHIIDIHLSYKDGRTFPANSRPWRINFYGSISALEKEKQATQTEAANSALLITQCFQQAKELGLDAQAMELLFTTVLKLDEAAARKYAKAIEKARKEADAKEAAQAGGGGFGGFGGGAETGGSGEEEPEPPPKASSKKPAPAGA